VLWAVIVYQLLFKNFDHHLEKLRIVFPSRNKLVNKESELQQAR
jgi:hypothetical protein